MPSSGAQPVPCKPSMRRAVEHWPPGQLLDRRESKPAARMYLQNPLQGRISRSSRWTTAERLRMKHCFSRRKKGEWRAEHSRTMVALYQRHLRYQTGAAAPRLQPFREIGVRTMATAARRISGTSLTSPRWRRRCSPIGRCGWWRPTGRFQPFCDSIGQEFTVTSGLTTLSAQPGQTRNVNIGVEPYTSNRNAC